MHKFFILLFISLFSCQLAQSYKAPILELPDTFDKSYIEEQEDIQKSCW